MKNRIRPGIKAKRKQRIDITLDPEVVDKLDEKTNKSGYINALLRKEFKL